MSYQTAVSRMYALGHELAQTAPAKFDLAHMRTLLGALGHPEKSFRSVLIAGTNGKGSTAATLAAILEEGGWRVGLYTSPHLIKINERIRIQGQTIGEDEFAGLHDLVERAAERLVGQKELPWHPSFFETLTAMAFEHFRRAQVEIAVLEVGMGGRLDATNVVEPQVSVITDIARDHEKFLGHTLSEIAREKAGILRRGTPVVTLPQSPEANRVIGHALIDHRAPLINAVPYVPPLSPASESYPRAPAPAGSLPWRARYPLEVMGKQILVETPLIGRHQLRNVALAIAAAEALNGQGFTIPAEAIERGIRQTRWPGRFQVIPAQLGRPEIVLDVAHNPAGAWALRSTLSSCYGERSFTLLFGAMRDKAIREMAEILFPLAERVLATRADNPRSATPEEIRQASARTSAEVVEAPDVPAALERARQLTDSSGLIVVTGSIYVVGEAMRQLGLCIE